jgi:methionyl-tRNA formyltransferase
LRIVYFGSSASTFTARHFAAVLASPCHLAAVVDVPPSQRGTTNPLPAGLLDFAQMAWRQGIPAYEPADPNEPQFLDALRLLEPDLFIAVGYSLILKAELLGMPRLLAANFHASLLPEYRGKHPVFWTLRGGERWAGLTVHAMDPGIDTGDILYQVRVRTRRGDTVSLLYSRIMEQSVGLVERLMVDAERGSIPRRPQPEGAGSYFSSTTDDDFRLRWGWPAEKIRRFITITPGKCYVMVNQQPVFFHNAETEGLDAPPAAQAPAAGPTAPGTLLWVGRRRAVVAAGQGAMSSSGVQVRDHDPESFAGFCRRTGLRPGDRLVT